MWRQTHKRLQGERGTDLERYHQGYRHATSPRPSQTFADAQVQTQAGNKVASGAAMSPLPSLSAGESPQSGAPAPDVDSAAAPAPAPVTRSLAPRTQLLNSSASASYMSSGSSVRRLRGANPPRFWLALVATLLIVVAVISTLAAANRLMSLSAVNGATVNRPLSISTIASGQIRDPEGAAFSPDGRLIAVAGFQSDCSFWWINLSNCGHALVIYDAHTGAVWRRIPLESLIDYPLGPIIENGTMPRPNVALSGVIQEVVSFASLGWSPDSTRIALAYTVLTAAQHLTPDGQLASGLLVVDVAHNASFTIQGNAGYFAGFFAGSSAGTSGSDGDGLPLWNLLQRFGASTTALPPSFTYSWNVAGQPFAAQPVEAPVRQLPSTAGPLYPVGSPDGGAPFTLWQPGVVIGPGSANLPGQRAAYIAPIPVWSDDGAMVTEITIGVALQPPAGGITTTSAPVGTPAPGTPPSSLIAIPARDAALSAVQQAVGGYGWALVGWNPDGSLLADISCFSSSGSTETLELRSTANGTVINSIPLALGANDHGCQTYGGGDVPTGAYPDANMTLGWSPDGTQTLVCDRDGARLTLWTVK